MSLKENVGEMSRWGLILIVLIFCLVGAFLADVVRDNFAGEDPAPTPCWPNITCGVDGMPSANGYQVLEDIRYRADTAFDNTVINKTVHRKVMKSLVRCAADMNGQYPYGNTKHCEDLQKAHAHAVLNTDIEWVACIADLDAGH
jgi:hypothetical protein